MDANRYGVSTLDERVMESIGRDVKLIRRKMWTVLLPFRRSTTGRLDVSERPERVDELRTELRDWDLWGPLVICLALATILSLVTHGTASIIFSLVFVDIWVGASIVTLNATLLGGKLSFFQSVCLLGYSVTPLLIAALLCVFWNMLVRNHLAEGILRFSTIFILLIWSLFASSSFLADAEVPSGRKALAQYPLVLFFCGLAWTVLMAFE